NSDYFENLYKNNLYYLFDLYNNIVMTHEEIGETILKNFINIKNDIIKQQSENLVNFESDIIETINLFCGTKFSSHLDTKEIVEFKLPKELLYFSPSYEILLEIFKYITYLGNIST